MSILDSVSHKLGTIVGQYHKGFENVFSTSGSRPAITDETAWMTRYGWGEALAKDHRPKTTEDFIRAFTSWVYICVKANAQAVASVPMKMYVAKRLESSKLIVPTHKLDRHQKAWIHSREAHLPYIRKSAEIEEIEEHPFLTLMDDVNPYHNSRDLKELTVMYMDLTGDAYWWLVKDGHGVPKEIYVIPSHVIEPVYGESYANIIDHYEYRCGAVKVELPIEDIVQFSYPNPMNVYAGWSCVRGIAEAVYVQSQMYETEIALFENRARVGGVFMEDREFPLGKPERERFKEMVKQNYVGAKRAGSILLAPRGVKFERDAMTAEEMSFIEGRRLVREEICAALDIPVGRFDPKANRANADASERYHAQNGVLPRCERYAAKINEKIMPMYGNMSNRTFCAFDNPVPSDRALEMKERESNSKIGTATINELRSDDGKDPVDGGDEPLVDSRLVPLSRVINPPEPPTLAPTLAPPKPGDDEEEDDDKKAMSVVELAKVKLREALGG